ncbi:MAG: hypothetical protein WBM40_11950 [Thiohalocapsa sp.]
MATETAAATLAAGGAAAGIDAVSTAGAAIKALVLSNPMSLAAVGGLVVGVLGYHFLFDHGEAHIAGDDAAEGDQQAA